MSEPVIHLFVSSMTAARGQRESAAGESPAHHLTTKRASVTCPDCFHADTMRLMNANIFWMWVIVALQVLAAAAKVWLDRPSGRGADTRT